MPLRRDILLHMAEDSDTNVGNIMPLREGGGGGGGRNVRHWTV